MTRPNCRCGHSWDVHQHFRAGDDCGICSRDVCRGYRRPHRKLRDRLRRHLGVEDDLRMYRNLLALLPYAVHLRPKPAQKQRAGGAVVYFRPSTRKAGRHQHWA